LSSKKAIMNAGKETVILKQKILSRDVFVGTGASHERISWPVSDGGFITFESPDKRQKK
jgi:hypothetical protein